MITWRQQAEDKAELEEQEQEISPKFKIERINKEFRWLSGAELFKPIAARLDMAVKEPEREVEGKPGPDYEMDEFNKINSFISGRMQKHHHQQQHHHHRRMRKAAMMKIFRPHLRRERHGKNQRRRNIPEVLTTDLRTLNRLNGEHKADPKYRVKSKDSPFYGYQIQ